MSTTWQDISKQKKTEQWDRIPLDYRLSSDFVIDSTNVLAVPRASGILSKSELDLTEKYDATALAQGLAKRQWSSEAVARAFCKRAAIAQQVTNCLTEIFFDKAIERAKELDAYIERHGKPIGPLHGVPVSLKDTFKVEGYDATIGYAALAFDPATENSPLVDILLRAGAVLYCKTNIPQTLAALDSHNNIFGRTLNPANLALTAGGSSGGEGALIAMRGSVLGVGTDVGGSIRVPALCNHIIGIKPSTGRIPFNGQEEGKLSGTRKVAIDPSAGPLATTLRDCELFLRTVAEGTPWNYDSDVIFGDWNSQGSCGDKNDIVIGVVRTDGVTEPLPPICMVLDETVEALRRQGIKVIEMDITPVFSKCNLLAMRLMGVDGGNAAFDIMDKTGEPLSPWLQNKMKRRPPLSLAQTREIHGKRAQLTKEFLQYWQDDSGQRIDAFICPVAPHPVPPIDTWNGVSYTSSFNLLDLPAAYLPIRQVRQSDLQVELTNKIGVGSLDKTNKALWNRVDRQVFLGSSLGVQVVAPKLQERRLLQAMFVIDEAVRHTIEHDIKSKL